MLAIGDGLYALQMLLQPRQGYTILIYIINATVRRVRDPGPTYTCTGTPLPGDF